MHRYDVNVCKPATGLLLAPRPTTYERCSSSALHAAQRLRLLFRFLLPAFFAAGLLPAPVDAASALSGASSSSSSPSSSSAPVAAAAAAPLAAPARSAARNSAS